jgi:hypothetical protein
VYEVPISYSGRDYSEGKKIGWKDGFPALWAILRFNLFGSRMDPLPRPPAAAQAAAPRAAAGASRTP